jgi:23S rRNA (uracil1939-C5)-methyltransferase
MKIFDIDITDLSHDGRGVARVDGKATFVAGALPGERVRARLVAKHRQYDDAEVAEVIAASPDRVAPACAHFGVCGGCALQHLAPAAQIAAKQRTLLENLKRIGDVEPARVLAPLTGAAWGYRRRGRLSVRYVEKKGRVLVGFRELNGRYVADVARCPVLHP